jgi:hypothetical protein
MPPIEEMDLEDTAVIWVKTGVDRYNEPVLTTPSEIPCRWIDVRKQSIGRDGTPLALDAIVIVADPVREGQVMWRGTLATWNPALKNELVEIVTLKNTPSSNGRNARIELGLRKFKQKL